MSLIGVAAYPFARPAKCAAPEPSSGAAKTGSPTNAEESFSVVAAMFADRPHNQGDDNEAGNDGCASRPTLFAMHDDMHLFELAQNAHHPARHCPATDRA